MGAEDHRYDYPEKNKVSRENRGKVKRLSSNLYLELVNGKEMLHCRCGLVLGPGGKDPRDLLRVKTADLSKAGPKVNPYRIGGQRFSLREYYCPNCLCLIETEVVFQEDQSVEKR